MWLFKNKESILFLISNIVSSKLQQFGTSRSEAEGEQTSQFHHQKKKTAAFFIWGQPCINRAVPTLLDSMVTQLGISPDRGNVLCPTPLPRISLQCLP